MVDPPPPGGKPSHNFGPDASPHRHRSKGKGGPKSERAPKGPMREMVRGQFFGGDDEEADDEELNGEDVDNGESEEESANQT